MRVLALETSTLTGSVALLEEERLVGEVTLSISLQHSERLLPAIQRLLEDANVGAGFTRPGVLTAPLQNIDLIAVAHGPGSFTGLRVGIATAQGLSLAWDKPVIGVSSLAALAMNGAHFAGLVVPVLDARRGEVYAAVRSEEHAVSPDGLAEILTNVTGPILLLGEGAERYREIFARRLGDRAVFAPTPLNTPRAANVAIVALREFQKEKGSPLVLPRYLRPAEVTFPRR